MDEQKQEFNHIVRIFNTDLDGNKKILQALRKIKGISFMFSSAICTLASIDQNKKAGYLEEIQVKKIEEILKEPLKFNIPLWMFNRRKDPDDGKNKHIIGPELKFTHENDIRMLKKIRCYKGVRHSFGLPVRGQRTKSNFRRNKGKVMGVAKSRQAKAAVTAKDKGKK